MKTKITLVVGLALGLLSAEKIHAEQKSSYSSIYSPDLKAKTLKPDLLGKTRTEYFTKYGEKVRTSETRKPDLFGNVKTTFHDKYGRKIGAAKTGKQDLFGKKKTTYTGHNPFNFFKDTEKKK